jgi:hypothetical protein
MFYEVLSIFKKNVFLTFDSDKHTNYFFHMTLLSVEGINKKFVAYSDSLRSTSRKERKK